MTQMTFSLQLKLCLCSRLLQQMTPSGVVSHTGGRGWVDLENEVFLCTK